MSDRSLPLPRHLMSSSGPAISGFVGADHRILVIDDNPAIHADVRKILCPPVSLQAASVDALAGELFGGRSLPPRPARRFVIDDAFQGREGLDLVQKAMAQGSPYAMAFVDVRMPPGWDGIETTLELWKVAPDLQVVICTAHSDYSWEEMLAQLGDSDRSSQAEKTRRQSEVSAGPSASDDRFVILKKPFDTVEILQLANALTAKWSLFQQARAHAAELERRVRERTEELESANASLQAQNASRPRSSMRLVSRRAS